MAIREILARMEQAERAFVGTHFLAPLVEGRQIMVRIAGVRCQMQVTQNRPGDFRGWAILQALSTTEAAFVRPSTLAETAAYLRLLPSIRLILVQPQQDDQVQPTWSAIAAHQGDTRLKLEGAVTLLLAEAGLGRFETVIARFDGRLFWYERRDPSRDPTLAAYLQAMFHQLDERGSPPPVEKLQKPGLSPEERAAYQLIWASLQQARQTTTEERIQTALQHAGAVLHNVHEQRDAYVVTYTVDGHQHVSTVQQSDLKVMTAGICLAGEDEKFDLASLVGVLREGRAQGQFYWAGTE